MKVKNYKDYRLFDYSDYIDSSGNEVTCEIPQKDRPFDLGDIVYTKDENSIGVVIGCVDYSSEDLRTDMDGMQGFCQVELATNEHFDLDGVRVQAKLIKELA